MIDCTMHYVWFFTIAVLTYEVLSWGLTLNKHAVWLRETEEVEKRDCFKDAWERIYMASVMACGLSVIVFFWEASLVYKIYTNCMGHETLMPWIIAGIQLSHIHFFAIIARCSCLEVEDWPYLSKRVSMILATISKRGADDG